MNRIDADYIQKLFSLRGRVAVVTGATGVLGGAMARGLAAAGARVGILGRRAEKANQVVADIQAAGGEALALPADVMDEVQMKAVKDTVLERWGRLDILVNAAGGNTPGATVLPDKEVFGMALGAFRDCVDLNLLGTVIPCLVLGEVMARQKRGCIVTISSMSVPQALTRVVGYSAGKAAMENFTRWLAVEMAQKYGEGVRVNAIAPGFFIGEQNRAMLLKPDGSPSERGQKIINATPMQRFGEPEELIGALLWLCSDAARFVTGTVIAVDGGFAAFSGV